MPFKELEKHTQRVKEPVKRDSTVYTSGEHQVTFGGEGCQEDELPSFTVATSFLHPNAAKILGDP